MSNKDLSILFNIKKCYIHFKGNNIVLQLFINEHDGNFRRKQILDNQD